MKLVPPTTISDRPFTSRPPSRTALVGAPADHVQVARLDGLYDIHEAGFEEPALYLLEGVEVVDRRRDGVEVPVDVLGADDSEALVRHVLANRGKLLAQVEVARAPAPLVVLVDFLVVRGDALARLAVNHH